MHKAIEGMTTEPNNYKNRTEDWLRKWIVNMNYENKTEHMNIVKSTALYD